MKLGVLVRKKDGSPSFANFRQVGKYWPSLTDFERTRASLEFGFTYTEMGNDLIIMKDEEKHTFLGAAKK